MQSFSPPSRVYGVDFSGAQDAGRNIWLAEGVVENAPADADDDSTRSRDTEDEDSNSESLTGLSIRDCRPATEWFDRSADRDVILATLTSFLADLLSSTAVGLDFPFGLPALLVTVDDWETFLVQFPSDYSSPDDLRARCTDRAELVGDGSKTKLFRTTDVPLAALSPYDLRLQSQTFYGIRDVLRPLTMANAVRVHPMQSPASDKPSLLEVYPAGTLDDLGLHHTKYKDGTEAGRDRRREILDGLTAHGVAIADEVRERAVADDGGDALDAIVAAVGAYRNTRDAATLTTDDDLTAIEGYIYV